MRRPRLLDPLRTVSVEMVPTSKDPFRHDLGSLEIPVDIPVPAPAGCWELSGLRCKTLGERRFRLGDETDASPAHSPKQSENSDKFPVLDECIICCSAQHPPEAVHTRHPPDS